MLKSQKTRDLELAYKLQQQEHCFGLTENAVLPKNKNTENYKPRTLVDQTLELLDPTPNIHTLFVQFNERYFWNVLLPVEVKWSPRMTSCAGVCSFHPRNRQCVISLSAPLLKLRPRKDLVETLLHEMIHGYLFLTNNNRDRDGHGPEFCKHMDRINKIAGTKITIYHSFHDEVKLYQQHWWRCNGPCQKRAPYFGTVRRAMNRAPGPNDFWWKEHQQSCGGQYIKIKEPENFKARGSKNKEKVKPPPKTDNSVNNMFNWLTKPTASITEVKATSTPKSIKSIMSNQNSVNGFKKLDNAVNNVHGWGTGGPNSSNNLPKKHSPIITKTPTTPRFSGSSVLGGSNLGRSNLLDKLLSTSQNQRSSKNAVLPKNAMNPPSNALINKKPISNNNPRLNDAEIKLVDCPICSNFVLNAEINKHVDSCLTTINQNTGKIKGESSAKSYNNVNPTKSKAKVDASPVSQKRKNNASTFSSKQPKLDELPSPRKANCPICNNNYNLADINEHLDKCLSETDKQEGTVKLDDSDCKNDSIISLSSTSSDTSSSSSVIENSKNLYPTTNVQKNDAINTVPHNCLVCNELIPSGTSLNDHLEDCIGQVFNDDLTMSIDCDNSETLETVSKESVDQSNKFPCPVCMQLITGSLMNQHLDMCLASTWAC